MQPGAPALRSLQAQLLIRSGQYPQAALIIEEPLRTDIVDNEFINLAYLLGTHSQDCKPIIEALRLRITQRPGVAHQAWLHLGHIYSGAAPP